MYTGDWVSRNSSTSQARLYGTSSSSCSSAVSRTSSETKNRTEAVLISSSGYRNGLSGSSVPISENSASTPSPVSAEINRASGTASASSSRSTGRMASALLRTVQTGALGIVSSSAASSSEGGVRSVASAR